MDNTKKDGGPAFPVSTGQSNDGEYGHQSGNATWQFPGMTLRDYFAAKAMQGMCAHPDTWGLAKVGIARVAYEMADAMLKARAA